ncbi:MAG TPA: alkaline phosphatase family protein [Polyangiaceae bacterium]|nr:alkaline phosphatase family protein [Polyangiaceae bacterium]
MGAQLLAALVFVLLSRAESGRPAGTRDVPCAAPLVHRPLTIVFVDSLSDRLAHDASLMPALNALAARGVSLDVSPCRDQLTYLCLRALLTGYDESSLLALRGNFEHAPSESDNWLDRLARAGRKVIAVGSHDFEPYQSALFRAKFRDGDELGQAQLLSDLDALDPSRSADVTLIALSNGDRMAHAYGARAARYRAAFQAIDDLIARIVTRAGPDSDILVFGDHGHDEMGRHLPGLPSTTVAVYAGPSFRQGVHSSATLTDHRALLGVLLGVPSPPSYAGPAPSAIFRPDTLTPKRVSQLAALRTSPKRSNTSAARLFLSVAALACALLIAQRTLQSVGFSRRASWSWAIAFGSALAVAGRYYDAVRHHIHDHGSEPQRSFWLLLPLALGFGLSLLLPRQGSFDWRGRLERGALTTVLLSLTLLFPTAYYYGASRATVLAAMVALGVLLGTRGGALRARSRVGSTLLVLLASGLLWSLYGLRDVGGRTREMAFFVFSSPLFAQHAQLTSVALEFGLWLTFAWAGQDPSGSQPARRSRRDSSFAALLALAALLFEHLPAQRALLLGSALGCLVLLARPNSRLVATRLFLGLLALAQMYEQDPLHLLPMKALLCCVAVTLAFFRRCFATDERARSSASGVALAFAAYLMLWPTVGMRFSGIDFHFMFAWVPIDRYEELWWLIAAGTLFKFVWPYALLVDSARRACPPSALSWAYLTFSTKLCALSVFATWYATSHSLLSNGALEILAELSLLVVVGTLAWPSPLRALAAIAAIWTAKRRSEPSACVAQPGAS